MTDTTTAPPIDSGRQPQAEPEQSSRSERFFGWVGGLGIVRADGWLGGVCGGIAARLRIDPLIIRGIAVVAAVVGLPALLVYAIAWALLPDATGRIHLRELVRGRFEPAMVGILILTLVSLLPVVPWLWRALLWPFWLAFDGTGALPDPWGYDLGWVGAVLGFVIAGALVFLIVRSARADRLADASSRTASAAAAPAPPAASDSGDDAATATPATPGQGAVDSVGAVSVESTGALPAGAAAADGDAVADWRARREQWRAQNDEWRRTRHHTDRSARDLARRERQVAGAALAAEADERRRLRRAANPRASFVFVVTALGAALVAGAVGALLALGRSSTSDYAVPIGIFAAAGITGLAMVVAGVARRRSGFLTAVTLVLLLSGLATAAVGGPRDVAIFHAILSSQSPAQRLSQLTGTTDISVEPLSETHARSAGTIDVQKGQGYTYITVNPGTELRLSARLGNGSVTYQRVDADTGEPIADGEISPRIGADGGRTFAWTARSAASPDAVVTQQRVVLNQLIGSVFIMVREPQTPSNTEQEEGR